jgi:hypothetical protein
MNKARALDAGKKGVLATIGTALIATGISLADKGDPVAGGILAGIGAVILMVANYIGR